MRNVSALPRQKWRNLDALARHWVDDPVPRCGGKTRSVSFHGAYADATAVKLLPFARRGVFPSGFLEIANQSTASGSSSTMLIYFASKPSI
jgi:hypothetical protein